MIKQIEFCEKQQKKVQFCPNEMNKFICENFNVLINNKRMQEKSYEQKQECFIQQSFDQIESKYLQGHIHYDVDLNIHKQLPANELRNIARPQNLIPRTLTINKYMTLLPDVLNAPCVEKFFSSKPGTNRIKIANKEKLSIEEFFAKKQYREAYNRLSSIPADSKNFSGKLLSIDSVADYNHKMFKQLERQQKQSKTLLEDSIDADFQSGNLCRAFVSSSQPNEYFLIIQNDINTYGYNIWFFFRFRNIKKGLRTFNIVNMIKKTDNYKKGMHISIFSMKKHQKYNTAWFKGGEKINFGETNFTRIFHLTERYYYLSFQYDFQEDYDEVYFALNQPYTYSRMIDYISGLDQKAIKAGVKIQTKKLGHTLADNIIPSLKIWTESSQSKETILITARQHPCETVSSFVCEGLVNYLLSETPEVKMLLQKYQFIVIPMVNPDGVIHGSSRCNLAGFDLNRQWSEFLIKEFTPETHRIKKYLTHVHKSNSIKYFFDLHGHGKKLNSFFFSCKKGDNPSSRLIELVMNKIEPRFNIMDCTYGIDREKQNTVRSQFFQMGVQNCYTLENSLMGYVTPQGEIEQYNQKDLFHIGQSVLKGIFVLDKPTEVVEKILGFSKEDLLESSQVVLAKIFEKQKDDKKAILDDNASDSDPEGDILDINERIEKCCKNNMNLKKKITETIKKEKVKKKKTSKEPKKQDRKLSSNSETDSVQKVLTAVKAENEAVSKQNNDKNQKESTFSQEKRNMTKLSFNNKRTTIYSKKVKDKKQTQRLEQKRLKTENDIPMKKSTPKIREVLNSTEIKFKNQRLKSQIFGYVEKTKTSCSIIYEYPHEGMINTRRKMSTKMKTEGHIVSEKEIPGVFYHESETKKDMKIVDLKEESLRALLTDTFSVLKIKPKLSVKRYVKVNPYEKQKKQQVMREKLQRQEIQRPMSTLKKGSLETSLRTKTFSHSQMPNFSQRSDTNKSYASFGKTQYNNGKLNLAEQQKYKRFESFLYNTASSGYNEKMNSSVFYYFPVL